MISDHLGSSSLFWLLRDWWQKIDTPPTGKAFSQLWFLVRNHFCTTSSLLGWWYSNSSSSSTDSNDPRMVWTHIKPDTRRIQWQTHSQTMASIQGDEPNLKRLCFEVSLSQTALNLLFSRFFDSVISFLEEPTAFRILCILELSRHPALLWNWYPSVGAGMARLLDVCTIAFVNVRNQFRVLD